MRKELIVHKNPKSPNSEIFRTLRTNIQFMNTNKSLSFSLTKYLCILTPLHSYILH